MEFTKTSKVSHPAQKILDLMIDNMDEIVPFLPNVEGIEPIERTDNDDGTIKIIRRWQGAASNIPSALSPFVSKEVMAWTDTALWTPAEYKVDWQMSTSLSAFYECGGTNYFEPFPGEEETATQVRVCGDLQIYPDQLPGVPGFLASRLAPQIEKFVVALLTPNMEDLAVGLQNYFDEQ